MKKLLLSILVMSSASPLIAQNVNIPDANFKTYLLSLSCNSNADNEIQLSEAQNWAGSLYCSSLNITDLTGIEAFNAIIFLQCNGNQLTTVDLSNNLSLQQVNINNNQLASLNLGNNNSLTYLSCNNNLLTELDVSNNSSLNVIDCSYNLLSYLNVANGNNSNMPDGNFWAQQNPNLTCIQVDDVNYSSTNWTSFVDPQFAFNTYCTPPVCTVNIPDANFKAYLVGNSFINTNANSEIECSEAAAFTGILSIGSLNISDLTGLEAFTSITGLFCFDNQFPSLDVTSNSQLELISCYNNPNLTTVDLSNSTSLITYQGYSTAVSSLDFSNCPNMDFIRCSGTSTGKYLTSLNIQNCTALTNLTVISQLLPSLDISDNTNLTELDVTDNLITTLDMSNNTALSTIKVGMNNLTSIDASLNPSLNQFSCFNSNNLTFLNLANGNTTGISNIYAPGTPNLTCIQIDDSDTTGYGWDVTSNYLFDPGMDFSNDCATASIDELLSEISLYPNPTTSHLYIEVNQPEIISVSNLLGEVIFTTTLSSGNNVIDVSLLTPGVYMIQTNSGRTQKFIKE